MELELAKISLERDSLSQQLLRVIRQKMALSQELEAWQVSHRKHFLRLNPEPLNLLIGPPNLFAGGLGAGWGKCNQCCRKSFIVPNASCFRVPNYQ